MADEERDIEQVVADAQVVRAGERRPGFPDQTLFWSDDLKPALLEALSRVVYRPCPTCEKLLAQVDRLADIAKAERERSIRLIALLRENSVFRPLTIREEQEVAAFEESCKVPLVFTEVPLA